MPIPLQHAVHKRSLLRDDVYESLRDAIIDGTLAPGERLRDTELVEWLGTSRTPIREALLRLERAGLVTTQPGRATLVAPFDPVATTHVQQVVAAMHELAARIAIPRVTDKDIQKMQTAATNFKAALDSADVLAALEADDDFHRVFVDASGNDVIREVLEQHTPILRRVERARFSSQAARESIAHHERIIEFARDRDIEAAASVVRENWLSLASHAPEHTA